MRYAALFLLMFFIGCTNADQSIEMASVAEPAPGEVGMDLAKPNAILTKVIREGNLRFETSNLDDTFKQVQRAVVKYNGTIENDVSGKDYESLFRNVTVRIPSVSFNAFLADVSKGVNYFDRREISARDVTEEFIDLSARLKTKKQLEQRYLELLGKASKVSEILEIEKELSVIREEIESKEGQLKYLESRVSMSTISIEFYKKTAHDSGITMSYGAKMWTAIKSGFNAFSGFIIGVLYMWPFIVILVILFFILRRKLRARKSI